MKQIICITCNQDKPHYARQMCQSCYIKWLKDSNPTYKERQKQKDKEWYENVKGTQEFKEKQSSRQRKYRASKRDELNAKERERRKDPAVKEAEAARKRQYRANNREKLKDYNLRVKYKITLEEYNQLAAQQNNKCAICQKEGNLVVDHCHETGKVCGLLCHTCNSAIGLLQEDAEIIQRAADYVKQRKISKKPNTES